MVAGLPVEPCPHGRQPSICAECAPRLERERLALATAGLEKIAAAAPTIGLGSASLLAVYRDIFAGWVDVLGAAEAAMRMRRCDELIQTVVSYEPKSRVAES